MQMVREIMRPRNGQLTINLPRPLADGKVEIIVFPAVHGHRRASGRRERLVELLKNGPTLGTKEIERLGETRKWMEAWRPEKS